MTYKEIGKTLESYNITIHTLQSDISTFITDDTIDYQITVNLQKVDNLLKIVDNIIEDTGHYLNKLENKNGVSEAMF